MYAGIKNKASGNKKDEIVGFSRHAACNDGNRWKLFTQFEVLWLNFKVLVH